MTQEDFELAMISVGDDSNLNLKFCTSAADYLDTGYETMIRVPVKKDPNATLGEIEADGRTMLAHYIGVNS